MKVCVQCAAEVPADDSFCGKCGHAVKRSPATDATLPGIRELEPVLQDLVQPPKPRSRRPQQATVLGLPQISPRRPSAAVAASPAHELKKTMMGMPRPAELDPERPSQPPAAQSEPEVWLDEPEPLPEISGRRQSAFLVGALLIALALAWLGYRLLSSHG
jgi:hypothetical protein